LKMKKQSLGFILTLFITNLAFQMKAKNNYITNLK
jgi:heme/copper-type cytochrome/quinol oxidase subunit 4